MTPRAGIVVTGTEVLTGLVTDVNGPWLSEELRGRGVEVSHVVVVGDRPEDLRAALSFLRDLGVALIVTSGGLGPTADDLTTEVVAEWAGRPLVRDAALEGRIGAILERLNAQREDLDPERVLAGNRKQALVPEGATVLEPEGTAPGLALPSGHGMPAVVVLPGPPRELRPMWETALASEPMRAVLARAPGLERAMLRIVGLPESELAGTLRELEAGESVALDALEITTCLRRGEIEIATLFAPEALPAYEAFADALTTTYGARIFSRDGRTIDELVAEALRGPPAVTVGVAESCTGGEMAGRLTAPAGASGYVLGGAVVYANEAKTNVVGVPAELIEAHGAVSVEVARALADGARATFGTDLGIGITGVAGPGGGTEAKPVGTVCVSVAHADGRRLDPVLRLAGGRASVRDRTTTEVMHLLRRLLAGEG